MKKGTKKIYSKLFINAKSYARQEIRCTKQKKKDSMACLADDDK